jgi:predicted metal-dependent hydrolase
MPVHIDQLIRSRRKTIALIVERDGTVIVRAPLRTPEKLIRDFVESKAGWVKDKQVEAQKYPLVPEKQYKSGETFLFLGQAYPLEIVTSQKSHLVFDDKYKLAQNAVPKAKLAFTRWYKAQALKMLTERVEFYARKHGFKVQKIRISSARTRWGSCSSKGTLSFTWRLVMAPLIVIDYVVIHELVHLKIKNHSKKFWLALGGIMPEYKSHVQWLKKNGKYLNLDGT